MEVAADGGGDRDSGTSLLHPREQLEEAIKAKDAKAVAVLIENTGYTETDELNMDQPSLLDMACFHHFDEDILTVLIEKGVAVIKDVEIWKKALNDVMMNVGNQDESIAKSVGERSTVGSQHCVSQTEHMKRCLIFIKKPSHRAMLLKLVDPEKVLLCKGNKSLYWLYDYFRYGEWDFTNKTRQIMSCMDQELWGEALSLIKKEANEDNLDQYVDIHFPDCDAGSRLCLLSYAVIKDRLDIVQVILDKNVGVNVFCTIKHSSNNKLVRAAPIELAAELNQPNASYICEELLKSRANLYLQSTGPYGDVLHNVVKHGNLGVLTLILRARRYAREDLQEYLKHAHVYFLHVDEQKIVKQMLNHSSRFGSISKASEVVVAIEKGDFEDVSELLSSMNFDELDQVLCDHERKEEYKLIGYVICFNHCQVLKGLLDVMNPMLTHERLDGLMCNIACYKRHSPIELAVTHENEEIIKVLLSETHFNPSGWLTFIIHDVKPKIFDLVLQKKTICTEKILEVWSNIFIAGVEETIGIAGMTNILTLDFMKGICSKYTLSGVNRNIWTSIISNCFTCLALNKKEESVRLHQILLTVILNYMGTPTQELQTAWRMVKAEYGNHGNQDETDTHVTHSDVRLFLTMDRFFGDALSLQRISRYKIRQCCNGCFAESIAGVGFPKTLEEYLKSPMDSLQHVQSSEFCFSLQYL